MNNHQPVINGYDESCDLWSLGVILYTMLSGEVPFNSITTHRTAEDIVEDITRSKLSYDSPGWKNVSQAAKDLVRGLLTVDPTKRLTIKDLSRNPWLRGSNVATTHDHLQPLLTPSILSQASRSLIVRAVNVTMRAFQKAGQFQLSSVNDGALARRRYTKKSTDSCSSTSSSTTISSSAVVPTSSVPSSSLPHTRRLCGNGICRCRHALCPPPTDLSSSSASSFDFSDERLSQLIDQYPLTSSTNNHSTATTTVTTTTTTTTNNTTRTPPTRRYGMTLRSRGTATTNLGQHEFASPAPPPPLSNIPSTSSSSSSITTPSSLSSSITTNDISQITSMNTSEKRPLTSPNHHHHSLGQIGRAHV